jgi:hypothetical protein
MVSNTVHKVRGIFIKSSQADYQDPQFVNNWNGAKSVGLPRGPYHFYDSRREPKLQANVFWNRWKGDHPELMPVIDYEESYGGAWKGVANLKIFLEELMRLSGLPKDRMIVYTGYYYWLANSTTNTTLLNWFGDFNLWLAWYTTNPAFVKIPAPWKESKLLLWQWGTPVWGEELGAGSKEIDANWFIGTEEDYQRIFGLSESGDPPATGEAMFYKCVKDVSVRNNTNYPNNTVIDVLRVGDIVEGVLLVGVNNQITMWIQFSKIYRKTGEIVTLSGYCSGYTSYMVVTANPNPTPGGEPATMDITLAEGSAVSIKDTSGGVLFKWP